MTILEQLRKDPRISEVWSEAGTGDGFWANLKTGWACDGVHALHEWTRADLRAAAKRIEPCSCPDCKATWEGVPGVFQTNLTGSGTYEKREKNPKE